MAQSKTATQPQPMFEETAEGDSIEAQINRLEDEVEDLPPLPDPSEADLGELCRVRRTQFDQLELVDDDTRDLIGILEEDDDTEKGGEGILGEIEAEFEELGSDL